MEVKGNWHLLRALQVAEVGSHPVLLVPQAGTTLDKVVRIVEMVDAQGIRAFGMQHPKRGTKALARYYLENVDLLENHDMLVEVVPPSKSEARSRGWDDDELEVELSKARLAAEDETPEELAERASWLLGMLSKKGAGNLWVPLDEHDEDKVIDVARSVASLSGHGQIEISDMAEAVQYSIVTYVESSLGRKTDLIEPVRAAMALGPRHTITLEGWEETYG